MSKLLEGHQQIEEFYIRKGEASTISDEQRVEINKNLSYLIGETIQDCPWTKRADFKVILKALQKGVELQKAMMREVI